MTDFTPGAIITRENPLWDGDRPSWLRYGSQFQFIDNRVVLSWQDWNTGARYGLVSSYEKDFARRRFTAIRLDASDIVYRCIAWNEAHPDEPVMWPWYGGDEAPADYDGRVLFDDEGTLDARFGDRWDWSQAPRNYQLGIDKMPIIGYQRRPTTSLPEPAEEIHTSGYAETIEESPEDFARAACKRADMVAVKRMTESEAQARAVAFCNAPLDADVVRGYISGLRVHGLVSPDPTPLDIAKAEHPDIPAEIVESIAAIVKGEAK